MVELYPRNIPAKFHEDWPIGFEKKMFKEIVDGRRTLGDHNSSPLALCAKAKKKKEKNIRKFRIDIRPLNAIKSLSITWTCYRMGLKAYCGQCFFHKADYRIGEAKDLSAP